jgi:hypothetical protein
MQCKGSVIFFYVIAWRFPGFGFKAMTNNDFNEMLRIRKHFDDLQGLFQSYLPNVDPDLIYDLLTRLRENPEVTPTYTLEIYTKREIDSAKMVDFIYKITGAVATIYDNGTHFVINQKLSLDMLQNISDIKGIIEITGAPTTLGCWFSDSLRRRGI